jgi:hypothetical protein
VDAPSPSLTQAPVPHAPPRWLNVERVGLAAMLWPAVAVAAFVGPWIAVHGQYHAMEGLALAGWLALQVPLAWIALRFLDLRSPRAPRRGATLAGLLTAMLCGVLQTVPLSLCLGSAILLVAPSASIYSSEDMAIAMFCCAVAFPLGLWQGLLASAIFAHRRSPLDGVTRAVTRIGVRLAIPHVLLWTAIALLGGVLAHAAWLVPAALLPLAAVVFARARIAAQRRWLERVEAGAVRGWRVVDASHHPPETLARIAEEEEAEEPEARVLVATREPEAPFRDAEVEVPVAIVKNH